MRQPYDNLLLLLERGHRHFLEVIKADLDRWGIQDINNVQALVLYNIAHDEMTIGELTERGYYLGSNVSYNVKKMFDNGYLQQERSIHDRRSVRVKLSEKGLALHARLNESLDRHVKALEVRGITAAVLTSALDTLRKLERFWTDQADGPRVKP